MRHTLTAAALTAVLVLSGCGGDGEAGEQAGASPTSSAPTAEESPSAEESASATEEPSEEPSPEGVVVPVTIEGGQVSPSGERVAVEAGEPVTFRVVADAAGEMHVHSTPEQALDFGPGSSEFTITIDRPGVVEVELHEPPVVVVQLQVG